MSILDSIASANNQKPVTEEQLPSENIPQTKSKHLKKGPLASFRVLVDNFQTVDAQRPKPANKKTKHIRLITIAPSHYCEKVRWGLDLLDEDDDSPYYYTEDAHPPALSSFSSVPATRGSSSSVPVTVHDNNFIGDSTHILQHFCPFLYPDPVAGEILDFEEYLDRHLGATARCLTYHYMLRGEHRDALLQLMTAHTSKIESFVFGMALDRGITRGMKKLMRVNDESATLSEDAIRKVFARVSKQILESPSSSSINAGDNAMNNRKQKQYLFEDKQYGVGFTAADLTFAALSSVLLCPKELAPLQLPENQTPKELCSLRDELRNTPAGKHALQMYEMHRFKSTERSVVMPKIALGRNRVSNGVYVSMGIVLVASGSFFVSRL